MPVWFKAVIILTFATAMLWLGTVYGDQVSPLITRLELEVSQAFWSTWWLFVAAFIIMALVALPVGALLSMGGGLLFGIGLGGLAGWLSTSVAAILSFLVMRWWMGERVTAASASPMLNTLVKRLDQHSVELLMVLRIVPLVPFYLINVAGALSPMPTSRYVWASVVGLAPSTFLYATIGHSLGSWVEAQAAWESGDLLGSSLIGALVALAGLAALSTWGMRRLEKMKLRKTRPDQQ